MFGSWSSATTVISNKLLFWSVAWAGFELGSLVLQGADSNHSAITLRSVFQLLAIHFNFYKIVHCQQNNFFSIMRNCGIYQLAEKFKTFFFRWSERLIARNFFCPNHICTNLSLSPFKMLLQYVTISDRGGTCQMFWKTFTTSVKVALWQKRVVDKCLSNKIHFQIVFLRCTSRC